MRSPLTRKNPEHISVLSRFHALHYINLLNAVVSCFCASCNRWRSYLCCKYEFLASFFSQFREPASYHLMQGGFSSSCSVGDLIDITLFNNSSPHSENLANAHLHLIEIAKFYAENKKSGDSASIGLDNSLFDPSYRDLKDILTKPHLDFKKKDSIRARKSSSILER